MLSNWTPSGVGLFRSVMDSLPNHFTAHLQEQRVTQITREEKRRAGGPEKRLFFYTLVLDPTYPEDKVGCIKAGQLGTQSYLLAVIKWPVQ